MLMEEFIRMGAHPLFLNLVLVSPLRTMVLMGFKCFTETGLVGSSTQIAHYANLITRKLPTWRVKVFRNAHILLKMQ